METLKVLWNNDQIRTGGFYELAIEVAEKDRVEPIKELSKRLFDLDYIKGPFDNDFQQKTLDLIDFDNLGYIEIEGKCLPFKTYMINEEGEDGKTWFDVSIYTGILEEVLEQAYQVWSENAQWHKELNELLENILFELNTIYIIRLGMIGFEISGMYDLHFLLNNELSWNDISHSKFYLNTSDYLLLSEHNKKKANIIKQKNISDRL